VIVSATDAGGNVTSQTITVTVTDAAELSLAVSAQPSVAVDEVTERIIYTVQNGAVRQAVSSPTTFNLTTTGGGSFFSDVDGTALITSATIPAASDSFVVYYRQAAGAGTTATLTATRTAGDAITAASTPMNIIATAASASRLDGVVCSATTGNSPKASLTTAAGCSAAAGQLLVMVFGHSPTNNPYDMPTFTAPAGWTELRTTGPVTAAGSVVNLRSNVYYRVATTAGDYTPTFTPSAGTVRMSFVMVAVNSPNAIPVDTDAGEGAAAATTTIRIPAATATEAGAMLLAYAVQDIGSTSMAVPAGLAPVGIFDAGGQMVSIGIFSKDRIFPGATPRYGVTTIQDTNASVAGSIILKP